MGTVSFPGLGLEFHLNRVAFHIGSWPVYWYGIIIAAGFLLAVLYCCHAAKRFGIKQDDIIDMLFFAVPLSIVGARLYYILFYLDLYRREDGSLDFGAMVRIWDGGLAIYGGIIGGVLTAIVYSRVKKKNFWVMADTMAPSLILGQMLGRWGNFFNKEAFGGFTDNLFAMRYQLSQVRASDVTPDILQNLVTVNGVDYIQVHPTFLYESMWSLCVFIILLILQRKKKFNGQVCATYFFGYALGRVWIEGLRTDQLCIGNVPVSQALSAVLIIASVVLYVYCKKKAAAVPVTEGAKAETEQKEE